MNRRIPAALVLGVLLALPTGLVAGKTKKDKEKEKAWKEAKSAFARLYKAEDPKERRTAVHNLLPFADMGAAELVAEKVLGKERNGGVLETAVQVIAAITDPELVDWLVKEATGRGKWEVRAPLVEALGGVKSEKADAALLTLLVKEDDPRVLSMALFSVFEKALKSAYEKVVPHLDHEAWQVRVAAIEALGAIKDKRAIEPLIVLLAQEKGRLQFDIADALHEITGRRFGRDAAKWRKWVDEGMKPAPKEVAEKNDPGDVYRKEPTFFGIKVVSERVLFILDVSQSMMTPIDVDKTRLLREAISGRSDEEDEKFEDTIEWWKIKSRMDLAKAQLRWVIQNLRKTQQFEIAAFSDDVEPWNSGRLTKASSKAKARALQFVERLKVQEATAAGAVLDFAFDMAGPGSMDKNYKSGMDTIFFISDGAPSDRPTEEILDDVKRRNKLRKVKIHVVAILNFSTPFLRLLAEQNGGIYKLFKVEDK
jgi:hypothetical protein